MDYCIPHMLFLKCLIFTESYKTLVGVTLPVKILNSGGITDVNAALVWIRNYYYS